MNFKFLLQYTLAIYALALFYNISHAATTNTTITTTSGATKPMSEISVPAKIFSNIQISEQSELKQHMPDQSVSDKSIKKIDSVNESFILTQQQWSIPKSAQSILKMPALRSVMQGLLKYKKKKLMIRYPGGEVGILWASELKGWLVSLGVSSEQIKIESGSSKSDGLKLFVNNIISH